MLRYIDKEIPNGPALTEGLAWMFKGEPDVGLIRPRTWRPWTPPTNKVAADEAITVLLSNRAKLNKNLVSIRSPEDLQSEGILCPYYYNRFGIAIAYDQAILSAHKLETYSKHRTKLYELLIKDIRKSSVSIIKTVEMVEKCRVNGVLSPISKYGADLTPDYLQKHDVEIGKDVSAVLASISAMKSIENILSGEVSKFRSKKGTKSKIFATAFVRQLSFIYEKLTGVPLAESKPGLQYLKHCFASFGGKSKGWSRSIDNAQREIISEAIDRTDSLVDPGTLLLAEICSDGFNMDAMVCACRALYLDHPESLTELRLIEFPEHWRVSKIRAGGGSLCKSVVIKSLIDQVEESRFKKALIQ